MRSFFVKALILEGILFVVLQLFQVNMMGRVVVAVTGLLLLPVVDRYGKSAEKNQREYRDAVAYMEQFLCSYKRTAMLGRSLEDCQILYKTTSEFGKTVKHALYLLRTGEDAEGDIVGKTLRSIDQRYQSRRMLLMHQYVTKADRMGGDLTGALDILLRDLQRWKGRQELFQKQKNHLMRESFLSIFMALGISFLSCLLVPRNFLESLIQSVFYQITAVVMLLSYLLLSVMIVRSMKGTWLDAREILSEKDKKRQRYNYELIKKRKGKIWRYFAKKVCEKEILEVFSYWILSVLLFLQQDNIYRAVQYSMEYIDGPFRSEVEMFLELLYEDPISPAPYRRFFEEFELPEIQTGMKLLYSFQNNGYEDTSKQIYFLVEQNNLLMNQVETKHLDSHLVLLSFFRQIPMVIAAGKIILDLVIILLMTMGKYVVL